MGARSFFQAQHSPRYVRNKNSEHGPENAAIEGANVPAPKIYAMIGYSTCQHAIKPGTLDSRLRGDDV